jgi:CHAD domain-containing protein
MAGISPNGSSRAYRLKRKEAPTDGLRRVAAGRIADALEQLRGESSEDFAGAIHETRKDMKKLRSVLRLVRDEVGEEVYRHENQRFRDAGRLLSGPRDAEVKLATVESLEDRYDGHLPARQLTRFKNALRSERADEAREVGTDRATAELEAGEEAIEDWPLAADDWSLIAPGLERTYRRGRSRFADARAEASDAAIHEWRKRVKDLQYQLRLVGNSWKPVVVATSDQASELSDLLGDHHDLAVLRDDALQRRSLFADGAIEALTNAIDDRQGKLADEAFALGRRIYAEKPKAFMKRLRAYWKAWR